MTGNAYGKPPPMLQPRGDAARTFFEEEIFFFHNALQSGFITFQEFSLEWYWIYFLKEKYQMEVVLKKGLERKYLPLVRSC